MNILLCVYKDTTKEWTGKEIMILPFLRTKNHVIREGSLGGHVATVPQTRICYGTNTNSLHICLMEKRTVEEDEMQAFVEGENTFFAV
jgi:hypothetical protein